MARLANPAIALPEYRNKCGSVKKVSGPTSLCHWISQLMPTVVTMVPSTTIQAPARAAMPDSRVPELDSSTVVGAARVESAVASIGTLMTSSFLSEH